MMAPKPLTSTSAPPVKVAGVIVGLRAPPLACVVVLPFVVEFDVDPVPLVGLVLVAHPVQVSLPKNSCNVVASNLSSYGR